MPRLVKGPDGVTHAFPDDASDDEIRSALGGDQAPAPPPSSGWPAKLADVARGFGKSAAHTALDLGELAGKMRNPFNPTGGTLSDAVDTLYNKPGLSTSAMSAAREDTAYRNPGTFTDAEHIGAGLESLAEMAMPVTKGATAAIDAIPSTARAAGKFAEVAKVANQIPVDVSAPGDVALRIADLAQRGGGTNFGPPPVRQFIQYVTNPQKAPMTYEVARDFASNISRLSSKDLASIPPNMMREIGNLRVVLNKAVGDAAAKAGKGQEYVQAMNEYAKAKRFSDAIEAFTEGVKKKAVPYAAGGAAAGALIGKKLASLWGGE